MIDTKELRIGNHVCCEGMEISIDAISKEKIRFKNTKGTFYVDPENLQSIPLTPEILEKCRFENYSKSDMYSSYQLGIGGENDIAILFHLRPREKLKYYLTCTGADLMPPFEIKYVHELQNLYFSLTHKELEIKELQHA